MNCSNPMDAAVLADYWLASLADSEEEAVELHLLDCDQCGAQLRAVIALAAGVRKLVREGSLRVTAEDDMLIGRLAANLTGAERVDLCLGDGRGVEQLTLRDIPVHSGASDVVYQESMTYAKALPTSRMIARLVALDEAGRERLLAEYTFNHTRSLPGPGVW